MARFAAGARGMGYALRLWDDASDFSRGLAALTITIVGGAQPKSAAPATRLTTPADPAALRRVAERGSSYTLGTR